MNFISKLFFYFAIVFAFQVSAESMDDKLSILMDSLILKDTVTGSKTLAVLPFGGTSKDDQTGLAISEFAVQHFHASGRYRIVERSEFQKVLDELEFAASDLVQQDKQIQLGNQLTADRILMGQVANSMGRKQISARLIDVKTGEIIASKTISTGVSQMDDYYKELMGEKGQVSSVVYRSAIAPGWGQFYSGHHWRGTAFTTGFLGALGITIVQGKVLNKKQTELEDAESARKLAVRQCLESKIITSMYCQGLQTRTNNEDAARETYYSQRNRVAVLSVMTLAIYGLNLIDAAYSGVESKHKFDLYFSASSHEYWQGALAFNF